MPYVAYADLSAMLPPEFLNSALDDVGDGSQVQSTFTQIAQQASDEIDSALSLRGVPVPVAPASEPDPATGLYYPALIVNAARAFVAEVLYKRRGIADEKNPWSARASQIRTLLKSIALDKTPLPPELDQQAPSVTAITQPMQTVPCYGQGFFSAPMNV